MSGLKKEIIGHPPSDWPLLLMPCTAVCVPLLADSTGPPT